MAENRNRHGDDIVADGEREILADQAARATRRLKGERHGFEAFMQEDEIRCLPSDIRRCRRRHGDVGGGQRRRL